MLLPFISALWFGILTSISPCPLAVNIAAVSFLSKKIDHPRKVFISGVAYTFGRMLAYAILGVLLISSLVNAPSAANFLQKYMNMVLGPLLIIVGLFLMDILKFKLARFSLSKERQDKLADSGLFGSFALGFILALSFCPISAALFFGSLLPLALNHKFGIVFPFIYGIGTALPILVLAFIISLSVHSLSHWSHKIAKLEILMRMLTGIIFILVGVYYIWTYIVSPFGCNT